MPSSLKIALTGAHGTGKDTLIRHLGDLFAEGKPRAFAPVDIQVLGSSSRWATAVAGTPMNQETSDAHQMISQWRRRMWALEWEELSRDLARPAVLLSPRFGLDECAYEGRWVNQRKVSFESRLRLLAPVEINGQRSITLTPEMAEEKQDLDVSIMLTDAMVWEASEELDFWDVILWKRPKEGVPIEADGFRVADETFQAEIDQQFAQLLELPVFYGHPKIRELPRDVEEAKTWLETQVAEWKLALSTST